MVTKFLYTSQMPLAQVAQAFLLLSAAVGVFVALMTLAMAMRSEPVVGQPSEPLTAPRATAAILVLIWAVLAGIWTTPLPLGVVSAASIALSGALATALILGPTRLFSRVDPRLLNAAWLGASLALVSLGLAAMPDSAGRAAWLVAATIGSAIPPLVAAMYKLESRAIPGALLAAQIAAMAAAAIWGEKAHAAYNVGGALPVAVAAGLLIVVAIASLLFPDRSPLPPIATAILGAILAYLICLIFRLPQSFAPIAAGCAVAAVTVAFLQAAPDNELPPLMILALVGLAGGTVLLINRLYGMQGLGLAAVGLLPLAAGNPRNGRWLAAVLVALFAVRALLQVFLDRSYLRHDGVNITQTYAFGGLILGVLLPVAAARLKQALPGKRILPGATAILLTLIPLLVGYMVHLLPLAAFLAGLIAGAFVLALFVDKAESAAGYLGPLAILATAAAITAAPYLTSVINAPRTTRLIVLAVATFVALAYALAMSRRSPAERLASG